MGVGGELVMKRCRAEEDGGGGGRGGLRLGIANDLLF